MKLAEIHVESDGDVVTIEYVKGTDADAPDLTGLIPEMASEIVARMGHAYKPMIYKDSHGVWDEVVLNAGEFAGFRSLGVIYSRDEAIKRAIELRAMIAQASDDSSARAAIGLLTIFKDNDGRPKPMATVGGGPMTDDDLMGALADGLQAVVQAKAKQALIEILRAALATVPADKHNETFDVLDKVRKGYEELLERMAPKIGEMVGLLTRGPGTRAETRKAAEEAKTASKH